MNIQEVIDIIKIGFDKPKLYKRSVWNKAVKVMEFLTENTKQIVRTNSGSGLEKYKSSVAVTDEQLAIWALQYKRFIGAPILLSEVFPELRRIARELNVAPNGREVLTEYFMRHPEDKIN